jgi:squalene-associated FAD-dependent desaturase
MSVLVVGGGWAGLAAAVELARRGTPVTLLEASRQLGGRARAVRFGEHRVDNGQHLLLGAYSAVLDMLKTLAISEASVLRRSPLHLQFLDGTGSISLRTPRLPAPLHLAWGLLRAHGLSLAQGMAALRMAYGMRRRRFHLDADMSVQDYLREARQDPLLVRALWQPLCLAALNTPPQQASMNVFLRVLRDAFFSTRRASDVLLPIADLGTCVPEPARDYIERNGGSVRLGSRVLGIHLHAGRIRGVELEHTTLLADQVILATPPEAALNLLQPHAALQTAALQLSKLHSLPICTLYLQYPPGTTLTHDYVGLLGGTAQWVFDRGRLTGEDGLMAVVISGPGAHMREHGASLTRRIAQELALQFPRWPAPLADKLIRERRAAFAATVDVERHRPQHATPVEGLWLAGDYTATGYPATLEGAVRSGVECARRILQGGN